MVSVDSQKGDEKQMHTGLSLAPESGSYENTFENIFRPKHERANGMHHGIVVSGHRGGQGKNEPENTMRAFKKALG